MLAAFKHNLYDIRSKKPKKAASPPRYSPPSEPAVIVGGCALLALSIFLIQEVQALSNNCDRAVGDSRLVAAFKADAPLMTLAGVDYAIRVDAKRGDCRRIGAHLILNPDGPLPRNIQDFTLRAKNSAGQIEPAAAQPSYTAQIPSGCTI